MYKNQLQELAQRSCFNLPAYACIREGPDHAPRFKATVTFNGEVFESPGYCTTLRQAEHAAAEVALNSLSRHGPVQSLAARILDETGVCKNLLQETAQRAGVSLPVYTTVRSGPGHLPVFTCTVEVAGMQFMGETAKTKKQAEKNAAMAAWSALKKYANKGQASHSADLETDEHEQNTIARALAHANGRDEWSTHSAPVLPGQAPPHLLPQRPMSLSQNFEERPRRAAPPSREPAYQPRHIVPSWLPADRLAMPPPHMDRYGKEIQQYEPPPPPPPLVGRHTSIPIKPGMAYQPRMHRQPPPPQPQPQPPPPPHLQQQMPPHHHHHQQAPHAHLAAAGPYHHVYPGGGSGGLALGGGGGGHLDNKPRPPPAYQPRDRGRMQVYGGAGGGLGGGGLPGQNGLPPGRHISIPPMDLGGLDDDDYLYGSGEHSGGLGGSGRRGLPPPAELRQLLLSPREQQLVEAAATASSLFANNFWPPGPGGHHMGTNGFAMRAAPPPEHQHGGVGLPPGGVLGGGGHRLVSPQGRGGLGRAHVAGHSIEEEDEGDAADAAEGEKARQLLSQLSL